jgi:serine/threonine protein kinase
MASGKLPGNGDDWLVGVFAGSRYLIQDQLGTGGMAVVFKAVDQELGRPVALKVLHPRRPADEAVRERFFRESKAAAAVQHPHIIPVFDAGEVHGVRFIAMPHVAGGDVKSLLKREGPLPAGHAAEMISAVASALDAAHAAGLVHQDVKPENMLLDVGQGRRDHVYLTDFGICRPLQRTGMTGPVLGTLAYAAPEQIGGQGVDGRADQYALACTAFELLSGQLPFPQETFEAVIYAKANGPAPVLTSLRPELPRAVDAVLANALAPAPERRYATCGIFADALRRELGLAPYRPGVTVPGPAKEPAGPGTEDKSIPQKSRRSRKGWRPPLVAAISALAVAVAVIAAAVVVPQLTHKPARAQLTAQGTQSPSASPPGPVSGSTRSKGPTRGPDSSKSPAHAADSSGSSGPARAADSPGGSGPTHDADSSKGPTSRPAPSAGTSPPTTPPATSTASPPAITSPASGGSLNDNQSIEPYSSCGPDPTANAPFNFGAGLVGTAEPATSMSLSAGSSDYFYVGADAGGNPLTGISWNPDLSVTAAYSGNEAVSVGQSASDAGSFGSGSTNNVSIAGLGVTGYQLAGSPVTASTSTGTSVSVNVTTGSGDLLLVVVGGEGVGLLQQGGPAMSTLMNVTYSECGSDVITSAGMFAAFLPAGTQTVTLSGTTYSTDAGTSMGLVAYVLTPT